MAKRGQKSPQTPADQPKTLGEKIGEALSEKQEAEKPESSAEMLETPKTERKTGKSGQGDWASHKKFDKFKK